MFFSLRIRVQDSQYCWVIFFFFFFFAEKNIKKSARAKTGALGIFPCFFVWRSVWATCRVDLQRYHLLWVIFEKQRKSKLFKSYEYKTRKNYLFAFNIGFFILCLCFFVVKVTVEKNTCCDRSFCCYIKRFFRHSF